MVKRIVVLGNLLVAAVIIIMVEIFSVIDDKLEQRHYMMVNYVYLIVVVVIKILEQIEMVNEKVEMVSDVEHKIEVHFVIDVEV